MFAQNRRKERLIEYQSILKKQNLDRKLKFDYSKFQQSNKFLQGTGSLVFDRQHKIAYAALSKRTNRQLVELFCQQNGYKPCIFQAYQTIKQKRQPIYHTNVMMSICQYFALICLKSIDSEDQRSQVQRTLAQSKKEIIELTEAQINQFAGNAILLYGKQPLLVMSERGFKSLQNQQIIRIQKYCKILASDLKNIQDYGGGSARCLIAEIY